MYIKTFKELSKKDIKTAGGKGASLSEMFNLGVPVPNGYVITTNTFIEYLAYNKFDKKIANLLKRVNILDNDSLEEASSEIKRLIIKGTLKSEVEQKILKYYDNLDAKYVAVRSSATSEDGNASAWAGQLESFLNITKTSIVDKIKLCWASLYNPRAILYKTKRQDASKVSVAVVIQEMIESDVSGIAFSKNPINNNDEIIIEAIYGLGEAIVSGSVNPDTYLINKKDNIIMDKSIRYQSKMLKLENNNTNKWVNLKENRKQKLSDELINKLCMIVKKLEKHFNVPVDIEWGISNNRIYILQCRPITTINTSEISHTVERVKSLGNWVYYVTRKFNWITETTQIYGSGVEAQEELLGFNVALKNNIVLNGDEYYLDIDFKDNCKIFMKNFVKDSNFFSDFAKKEFKVVEDIKHYIKRLEKLEFGKISTEELMQVTKDFNKIYIYAFVPGYTRPDGFLEIELRKRLKKELGLKGKELKEAFGKISTCPNYKPLAYSEEPLDLLKLAKKSITENVNSLIEKHIKKYAWIKAPVAFESTAFTKEDYINRINFLKNEDIEAKIKQIIDTRNINDRDHESIIKKYKISGDLLKLAQATRDFIFLRTYTTEYSDYLFYIGRHTLLTEIAKRCKIELDDLIMLDMDEIIGILYDNYKISKELLDKIKERRKGFAILWLNGNVSTLMGHDALMLQSEIAKVYKVNNQKEEDKDIIKGTPANPGKVIGTAKILLEYNDIFKVEKGDIIIASMTTPDYVSAMEKAIGFVTDEGGITCHAAIISREFNVPCVVGTNNATQRIKTGQIIELDAYNGIINLIKNNRA
jgi:pyruvate,water dikinase